MKNIVPFLLLMIVSLNCKKKEMPEVLPETNVYFPGTMLYGSASAIKTDKEWLATAEAHRADDSLHLILKFATFSKEGFLRESINVFLIPKQKGSYIVENELSSTALASNYHIAIDGGDIPASSYSIDETAFDNELIITAIDTIANTMQGKFTLSFNKSPRNFLEIADHFEKVKFSNGTFDVQIRSF